MSTENSDCEGEIVNLCEHGHSWDMIGGKRTISRPWAGQKSRWERTCEVCDYQEFYDDGRRTLNAGWFPVKKRR